jgi:hypothetical protein
MHTGVLIAYVLIMAAAWMVVLTWVGWLPGVALWGAAASLSAGVILLMLIERPAH